MCIELIDLMQAFNEFNQMRFCLWEEESSVNIDNKKSSVNEFLKEVLQLFQ